MQADNLLPTWKVNLSREPTKGNIEKCEEDKQVILPPVHQQLLDLLLQLFLRKGLADLDHLLRFGSEAESGDFVLAWRLRG